jgi:uncharacterized protein (TIGR02246 family)
VEIGRGPAAGKIVSPGFTGRWGQEFPALADRRFHFHLPLIPSPSSKEDLMLHSARFGLAALLVLGTACQPGPKTETATAGAESGAAAASLSDEDKASIRAVDAQWARAATAGDGQAIAALYASDAILLPPGEPMVKGEAAKKYWVNFVNGFSGPIELNTMAVEGGGDVASAIGTYTMTLTPRKAGAKPLPTQEGKYLEVLKRQDDGSWKIIYDMWSPNAAPAKK